MVVGWLLVKPKEIKVQIRRSVKAGSVFLALALITTSCSSSDPQARIDELGLAESETKKKFFLENYVRSTEGSLYGKH